MAYTLYGSRELTETVGDLRAQKPRAGLLGAFFPSIRTFSSQEIWFDVEQRARRLAPFVSPHSAGKPASLDPFTTKSFRPAYIKQLHELRPTNYTQRIMGEPLNGPLSWQDRMAQDLTRLLARQIDAIDARLEWMAAQALFLGQVTVAGDDYPTTLIDFQRPATHRVTLTGATRWNQPTATPLTDIGNWASTVHANAGIYPRNVVMSIDVWQSFRNNAEVKDALNSYKTANERPALPRVPVSQIGLSYQSNFDNYDFWTYADNYIDPVTGISTGMLPTGSVILAEPGPQGIDGHQYFGAIYDLEAPQEAAIFTKSYTQDNPSGRYVLSQSAPLVVPRRPTASFSATVF